MSRTTHIDEIIAPEVLLQECGGEDSFDIESLLRSDHVMLPPIWTREDLAIDYYPPPLQGPVKKRRLSAETFLNSKGKMQNRFSISQPPLT